VRNEERQPLPKQTDREAQTLASAVDERANHSRSKHDSGRQRGADAAGSTSVTIAAGESSKVHHGLGHQPTGWRIVDATGTPASHVHGESHHVDPGPSGAWAETHYAYVSSVPQRFVEGFIIPAGALTADDVNYATLAFGHYDPSTSTFTSVGSVTTQTTGSGGTGNWVAGQPFKLSDYTTITSSEMAAGIVMAYDVSKTIGPGKQLPEHDVIFEHTLGTGCWLRRVTWDGKTITLANENNYALTLKVEVF
jgi:hypothetical protein